MNLRTLLYMVAWVGAILIIHAPKAGEASNIRNESSRIVGGMEVVPGSVPFQISLQELKHHFCGGAILNDRWILTGKNRHTALWTRYLNNFADLHGVAGVHNVMVPDFEHIQSCHIKEIIVHDAYDNNNIYKGYDIALLKLKNRIAFGGNATRTASIRLADTDFDLTTKMGTVTGWGDIFQDGPASPTLRTVDIGFVDDDKCEAAYQTLNKDLNMETIVCAGGQEGADSCQGDSGGPLVVWEGHEATLVGIVSGGTGCGRSGIPGFYTKVSSLRDWILTEIETRSRASGVI